jgi:hypothetical protein
LAVLGVANASHPNPNNVLDVRLLSLAVTRMVSNEHRFFLFPIKFAKENSRCNVVLILFYDVYTEVQVYISEDEIISNFRKHCLRIQRVNIASYSFGSLEQ